MTYTVHSLFHTLQGEGVMTGRSAVFLRFAGCNLWSGREQHRASAVCQFCDTEFVGGTKYTSARGLATEARRVWDQSVKQSAEPYLVCTGGEPLLQLDGPLIDALHGAGFRIAVETNGTLPVPDGVDWLCVSPKAGAGLVQRSGDELKLVWPQDGIDIKALEALAFDHFLLQPMDGHAGATRLCLEWCLAHPRWRLSLQTHKILDIP